MKTLNISQKDEMSLTRAGSQCLARLAIPFGPSAEAHVARRYVPTDAAILHDDTAPAQLDLDPLSLSLGWEGPKRTGDVCVPGVFEESQRLQRTRKAGVGESGSLFNQGLP